MNCFNHKDQAACGFCSACAKGLCHDCASFSENIMCCKMENCQEKVFTREAMNDRAEQLYGIGKYKGIKKPPLNAIMSICLGIALLILFYSPFLKWYSMLPGALFIVWGLIMIFRKDRINY